VASGDLTLLVASGDLTLYSAEMIRAPHGQ
jgi:hypothetical protein